MKISTSKLVANRANASKFTGPRSAEGKRTASENATRHGLASSSGLDFDLQSPRLSGLMAEAKEIGFSVFEAEALVSRLAAARNVIDAKHASYKEKPEVERLPDMTPEALYRVIKEMETPGSGVTSAERRKVIKVMYQQIKEDNEWGRRLAKRLDAHRKLMRYDQRAVNQLRKADRIRK